MEDGYLTVAMRHKGASVINMLNRLRFIQLVHAQHFVQVFPEHLDADFFEGLARHRRRKRRDQRANPTLCRYACPTKGPIGVAASKTDQYPSTLSPADAKTWRATQQV